MLRYCPFDGLPVELLHTLFTYFLVHEILLTFSDVSDRMNDVLLGYPDYHFNFTSIRLNHFNLVCQRIRPEQVVSLTLSDGRDTPGQTELFLSRFQIQQFTRLRSLRLIDIEIESLTSIFSDLQKLSQLCSFSFNIGTVKRKYLERNDYYVVESNMSKNPIDALIVVPLSRLLHLKFGTCVLVVLKRILLNAPKLKSLDVCLDAQNYNARWVSLSNQLIRLNLTIKNLVASMHDMEVLLPKFPQLKYLELQMQGISDVVDGNRWQKLTGSLIKFNFKILIQNYSNLQVPDSFQTSFWLEEKHWYVAYQNECLFSVPHFAPNEIEIPYQSPIYSTAPNMTIIYDHVTILTVNSVPIDTFDYFTHVKTLIIKCPISVDALLSIVDLNRIEHLSVLSIEDLSRFIPFEFTMPRLYQLTVSTDVEIDQIRQIKINQMKNIRKLVIALDVVFYYYTIEKLFLLFPNVKHLTVGVFCVESVEEIVHVIDRFANLHYLSFRSISLPSSFNTSIFDDKKSIINHSRRLTENNFTCRIHHLSMPRSYYDITWWIDAESSKSSRTINWLPRQGYFWYRSQFILLRTYQSFADILLVTMACLWISMGAAAYDIIPLPPITNKVLMPFDGIVALIVYFIVFIIIDPFVIMLVAHLIYDLSSSTKQSIIIVLIFGCLNTFSQTFFNISLIDIVRKFFRVN